MSAQGKEEVREGCGEEESIADDFGDLTFVGPDGWEYHPFWRLKQGKGVKEIHVLPRVIDHRTKTESLTRSAVTNQPLFQEARLQKLFYDACLQEILELDRPISSSIDCDGQRTPWCMKCDNRNIKLPVWGDQDDILMRCQVTFQPTSATNGDFILDRFFRAGFSTFSQL